MTPELFKILANGSLTMCAFYSAQFWIKYFIAYAKDDEEFTKRKKKGTIKSGVWAVISAVSFMAFAALSLQ